MQPAVTANVCDSRTSDLGDTYSGAQRADLFHNSFTESFNSTLKGV